MLNYNSKLLISEDYTIENARINDVSLSMEHRGRLELHLFLDVPGGEVIYGGFPIGLGCLGSGHFEGLDYGVEALMIIMDTVGVSSFEDLKDKYIRVAYNKKFEVKFIGNILKERWFNVKEFISEKVMIAENKTHDTGANYM